MLDPVSLQQISDLLDQKLEEKLDQKLAPIISTLAEHTRLLQAHEKTLKSHDRRLQKLQKNQDTMLFMLDREQVRQAKRLEIVEERLGIVA